MAQQEINVGASPNDGTGDFVRDAFIKTNDNFTELYGAGGASVNPTSGFLPINSNGTFVDSKIQQGVLYGSPTYEFNGLAKISAVQNSNFLNLDVMNNLYSFGTVEFSFGEPSVNIGMAINENKIVISNYSAWNPTFGLIQSGNSTISMGLDSSLSIGVNTFGGFSMLIGSGILGGTAPSNTTTPTNWITVTDENNNQYRIPAYQ
tara:strand:+ start:16519 stop:17133 length:615 start_codon:yes stop_codon:yes gene_type:complete